MSGQEGGTPYRDSVLFCGLNWRGGRCVPDLAYQGTLRQGDVCTLASGSGLAFTRAIREVSWARAKAKPVSHARLSGPHGSERARSPEEAVGVAADEAEEANCLDRKIRSR